MPVDDPMHMRKARPTCRRTGTKAGEPNACVRCPGYRAERVGIRALRGCARNDMHGPPAVGPLKRSPRWAGIDTCWASRSSRWSSANATNDRRKRLPRPSAGLLRNLWTTAQHETASMSTAHTAHRCRHERGRRTFAHLTPQASTAGCEALGSRVACPRQPCAATRALRRPACCQEQRMEK